MEIEMEMEKKYSFGADLLNTFQTSPEWIQGLWLLVVLLLLLGLCWCIKEAIVAFAKRKSFPRGKLVYSIHRSDDNELLIYSYAEEPLEKGDTENIILLPAMAKPKKIQDEPTKP